MNIWPWSRIRALEDALATEKACITGLQAEFEDMRRANYALRNQVDYLIRTIRQTDDIIFSISQVADGSWASIRPRIAQLTDQMTARKVAESDRINSLITSELHTTYRPDNVTSTKLLERK